MKKFILMSLVLVMGSMTVSLADPPLAVEKTPLPSGPLLRHAPAYSKWQVTFSYGNSNGGTSGSAPSSAPKKVDGSLPLTLTVTQTRPRWEVLLVTADGGQSECWYDGFLPYLMGPQGTPVYINLSTPGMALPGYLDNRRGDFPDVGWVSARTYLGTQPGTGYAVFQQEGDNGAIVYIDLQTRFPVRWQRGGEIRDFKFFPAPTERLVFPPAVEKLSKEQAHIRSVSSGNAPRGA